MFFSFGIYTLLTYPIRFLFFAASLFSSRAKAFRTIRLESQNQLKKFQKDSQLIQELSEKKVYWFHGASVGELDQAKAMARELKKNEPESYLILSWMSDSVTERNLRDSPADFHVPLPLDSPGAYISYFQIFRPKKVLIFSWDTWAWFLYTAKRHQAKIYLVCGTLSETSGRSSYFSRQLTRLQYSWLDGIYPAHPLHEIRFRELTGSLPNPPEILSLGDTRFDSVVEKMEKNSPPISFDEFLKVWNRQSGNLSKPILFASTYDICERGITYFLKNTPTVPNLWIFPHKIEPRRIQDLQRKWEDILSHKPKIFTKPQKPSRHVALYSSLLKSSEDPYPGESLPSIIIFDELGILAFAYKYGRFTYVGGGLHNRIHNTIEPSYWSLPILCGHRIGNSSEAMVLREMGGLFCVSSEEEMATELMKMINWSSTKIEEIGAINHKFVLDNKGASSKIYQRLWQ